MSTIDIKNLPSALDRTSDLQLNMRPNEAARYTSISESTLAKLRMRHKRANGPKFIKLSGCIIYRRSDLDAWMEQHVVKASI